MKKFDWKKYIYKIVVVVLIVFFIGGVGIGAANILSIEGMEELYTPAAPNTPFPDTDAEVAEYLNACIAKANTEQPKILYHDSFGIDEGSIAVTGGNEADAAAVRSLCAKASGTIEGKFEDAFDDIVVEFYHNNSDLLRKISIPEEDIESVTVDYQYYLCTMCNAHVAFADFADDCPECGNTGTLKLRYNDVYRITIALKPGCRTAEHENFPHTENLREILESGSNGKGASYRIGNIEKNDSSCCVYAEINRLMDKINTLRFVTDSVVSADITHSYGGNSNNYAISMPFSNSYRFDFTWPGLSLNLHTYKVEAKSTNVLKATLSCDDPTAYTVKWTSSDESIIKVDEEGYIKSGKKLGSATVTASYDFGGITYSDSCEVIVCVPAEGMDLSKGKLSLKTGETYTLKAKMDPKDTTNDKVYWFTEDENIATVDENGTVTAVSAGSVVVYAISDDGNYYSSCKVEVTG